MRSIAARPPRENAAPPKTAAPLWKRCGRREQVRTEEGEEQHTSLERRVAWIEAALYRLTERFTQLEDHLLQHIETLHRQNHEREEKNKEYLEKARETVARSKQRVKDTKHLIGYAQEQMKNSQDRTSPDGYVDKR
jgi:chromosome segregation ATPase